MEAANLPTVLKFGSAKKSDICVIFAKKPWVAAKLGAWSKTGKGGCALSRPGPKTATDYKPITIYHIITLNSHSYVFADVRPKKHVLLVSVRP